MKNFELLTVLGEGSFGRVKLTKEKKENKYWAFKQLKKFDIIKFK